MVKSLGVLLSFRLNFESFEMVTPGEVVLFQIICNLPIYSFSQARAFLDQSSIDLKQIGARLQFFNGILAAADASNTNNRFLSPGIGTDFPDDLRTLLFDCLSAKASRTDFF